MDPLSVTEVSALVKDTLRSSPGLCDIAVRGEVTGYTDRGHRYFSLKDENSVLKCVIWKFSAGGIDCLPLKDGTKVVAWGSVTSWGGNSSYQLDVRKCTPEGRGELYRRFLELKEKLLKEGLFAPEAKVPIPAYPESLGIVTSEKGAALQDMAKVFMNGPGIDIAVADARVQGDGAAESIAAGIRALDGRVDLIIIGRGGGSLEDLWAFNEELLARAVFACRTPIISGVGHEIDEVITDLVADARASTPTAAAELVVKAMQRVLDEKKILEESIAALAHDRFACCRQELESIDMAMWRKVLASRLSGLGAEAEGLRACLGHSASMRVSGARKLLDDGGLALRTTWVAAIKEKGMAAMYQGGDRIPEASRMRKGRFEAVMKDGRVTGEVKEIEV